MPTIRRPSEGPRLALGTPVSVASHSNPSAAPFFSGIPEDVDFAQAERILGPLFINPSEYQQAYGITIPPSEIPPIPFTKETLEDAQQKGSYLLLQLDIDTTTGKPLTIEYLNSIVLPKLQAKSAGQLIGTPYPTEPFYATETPRKGWVIIEKDVLDRSTNTSYTEQTLLLRRYIETLPNLSLEEQQAIAKCTDVKLDHLHELKRINKKQAALECVSLPINRLFRNRASETVQQITTLFLTRNIRYLGERYDWGSSRWVSGLIVYVGVFDSQGICLGGLSSGYAHECIGTILSRRG